MLGDRAHAGRWATAPCVIARNAGYHMLGPLSEAILSILLIFVLHTHACRFSSSLSLPGNTGVLGLIGEQQLM